MLTFTSISSTALTGDRTITIYGTVAGNETVTGSFKITLMPAYCNTVDGIVNMMAAPVVSGTPNTTYSTSTSINHFTFTSKLFNTAQLASTYSSCDGNVAFTLFVASNSSDLSGLDNQAANDNLDILTLPSTSSIKSRSVTFNRNGNDLTYVSSIARSAISSGTNYYRIGKRITKEGEQDPYVFSTTYSFSVPAITPIANAGSDQSTSATSVTLNSAGSSGDGGIRSYSWTKVTGGTATISTPTSSSTTVTGLTIGSYTFRLIIVDNAGTSASDDVNINITGALPDLVPVGISRPLYLNMGANLGDGTYTYYRLDEIFCTSLPTLTSYIQDGSLPSTTFASTADKRIMKLNYPLPAMNINFKNNGTVAACAFQVQVLKPNSSTILFSGNVASLAAGASGSITYNTRGTAVVYRFPGFDGVDDMRFCYVREELNHTLPATIETGGLTIKVDSGSAINEGTNEPNNTRNYTQP